MSNITEYKVDNSCYENRIETLSKLFYHDLFITDVTIVHRTLRTLRNMLYEKVHNKNDFLSIVKHSLI